jgi:hypothetical protein
MYRNYSHAHVIPLDGPIEIRLKFLKLGGIINKFIFFKRFLGLYIYTKKWKRPVVII